LAISQLRFVRCLFAAVLFLALARVGDAQVQEAKLMDRLLKPDMSLQNDAQGRQFTPRGTVATKKAPMKFFLFTKRPREKEYTNVRQARTKEFGTDRSRLADRRADTSSRNRIADAGSTYASASYETHAAPGANRTVEVSDYSRTKSFTARGKSQKSLDAQQQRPSMTIDEVRELLNKNK
jgi:hypothetical protein